MSNVLGMSGFTGCMSKAGLKIGSTATEVATATPDGTSGIVYAINGISYYKVDDATATLTVHPAQAADTSCMYLICVNAAGTISSVKGEDVLTTDIGVNGSAQIPAVPNDVCPIGAFKMTTVSVTFTTGTTDLDATGCTATYYDYGGGIAEVPQVS